MIWKLVQQLAKKKMFRPRLAEHSFRLFSHLRFFNQNFQDQTVPTTLTESLLSLAKGSTEEALTRLNTSEFGLTPLEVAAKQAEYGSNQIRRSTPTPWWVALWLSYANPFSLLLTLLALISYYTDDIPGTIVISCIITLATLIRFTQERKSRLAAESLKALITPMCTVIRQADTPQSPPGLSKADVPSKYIVPGDIVSLSSGDIVPADLRLLHAKDLQVNQSILTGESMPVEKNILQAEPTLINPLESPNICFMGTTILSGSATAVVIATGNHSYFGILAERIGVAKRAPTQFQLGINKVSWLLLSFMAVMAPFVLFVNGFTKGDWTEAILFSLSVAVGLTPEMLPMIVTSTLAKGAVLLSRQKVVVKRLDAIQDFGAMNILCTDKTGTLTQGQITLSRYADAFGTEDITPLSIAYLNSFFQTGLKNEMDAAILTCGKKRGLDVSSSAWQKKDEIPFDFSRRRMSVILEQNHQTTLLCKGALEEVLGACTNFWQQGRHAPLTEEILTQAKATAAAWNQEGLRVVAIASKVLPSAQTAFSVQDESNLTLIGYIAFLDPPKETSAAALEALQRNGIAIKILTGDNELVSKKICNDVGLDVAGTLLGPALETMTDQELAAQAAVTTIFAKLSPLHKERIVRILRSQGNVVGYMGDGINDAPALHAADVGISVNTAVDVAKDAADLILLEKSLMVLDQGVVEGRKIFINMLKYIKMTASSNFGNVFSVLIASIFIPFLPMLPLHILVQNLLYDISQIAIPFDNVDKDLLAAPQRWDSKNLGRFMAWFGPVSSVFDIATFCLMWYVFQANSVAQQTLFQSGWFIEGLLSQTLIVHVIRTRKIPFIQSRASAPLLLTTTAIMATGIFLPMGPLAPYFKLQALPLSYFVWLSFILLGYLALTQLVKRIYTRYHAWQ